jgi:hypothetical protein
MRPSKITHILFITFIINYGLYSQEVREPVNIQSPNAASLGRFGDVPVSYYTGTPSIGVPIHTLSVNGIDLNINLSYDASGVRLDQHPGWVGQNWSLSAGGVIVKAFKRLRDEINYDHHASTSKSFSNDYPIDKLVSNNNESNYFLDLVVGIKDGEPDINYFNFATYSGIFLFDKNQNILSKMGKNYIINFERVECFLKCINFLNQYRNYEYQII